jgi:hypothetical protein
MRQVFSRLVVAAGFSALACATAMDPPLTGDDDDDSGGSTGTAGSLTFAGSGNNTSGSGNSSGSGTVEMGGKGGSGTNAFGGTSTTGGSKGGTASGGQSSAGSGGAAAGSSAGGSGGAASGGKGGSGGTASGGKGGTPATGGGGSGSGGSASTTCNGVADWTSKTYVIGDIVANTCSGPFAGSCPAGQKHKFECNPADGVTALPWCQQRPPGAENGWAQAWIDKGQCN